MSNPDFVYNPCKTCHEIEHEETKLKQHKLDRHKFCSDCDLGFANIYATARHLKEVHNIISRCPFGCDFLIFAPDMKIHMKYKHKCHIEENGTCVFCWKKCETNNLLQHYID